MAQKRSRKQSRGRDVRKPELRQSRYNPDGTLRKQPKAEPSATRQSRSQRRRTMRVMRVRPEGTRGVVVSMGFGVVITALVTWAAFELHRWGQLGYMDSLWLWVAIAGTCAAPAVAYVARERSEAELWELAVVVVSFGLLGYERAVAPTCLGGVNCDAFGALGQFGIYFSALIVLGLGAIGWAIVHWFQPWRENRRRGGGYVTAGTCISTQTGAWILTGLPLVLILLGVDIGVRPAQKLPAQATSKVFSDCFPLLAKPASLEVRPDPEQRGPTFWINYLVRQSGEHRSEPAGTTGGKHPTTIYKSVGGNWVAKKSADIYEAEVAYDANTHAFANLECRFVSSDAGKPTAADVAPANNQAENPNHPPDLLASPGSPTPSPFPSGAGATGATSAATVG